MQYMPAPQKRNRTLDVTKGLLILLVVVRHVLQYSVSDEGGILTNYIWPVQMPGFMLIAGYLAARRASGFGDAQKRIARSARHYAMPFFTWFILVDCLLLAHGRDPLVGLLNLMHQIDGGLWFLWVVFVLSVVASLGNLALSSGRRKIMRTGFALLGCFSVFCLIGIVCGVDFLGIKFILYYAVFYGFGWLAKWLEDWWRKWWTSAEDTVLFLCLFLFLAIVHNVDLYHAEAEPAAIVARMAAGFSGNAVLFAVCRKYEGALSRIRLDWIGMYTLEIYATHMYVNRLMRMGDGFFTLSGFANFARSLAMVVFFTAAIIAVLKAIPVADFLFYGKRRNGG